MSTFEKKKLRKMWRMFTFEKTKQEKIFFVSTFLDWYSAHVQTCVLLEFIHHSNLRIVGIYRISKLAYYHFLI